MKDILQDLVAHTHALGFIPLVRISNVNSETVIEAMSEDKTVVIQGKTKTPVPEFEGVFGLPNLNKLDINLKCPEYKENSKITVTKEITKEGEKRLAGLHFENEAGDFQNDYRIMNETLVNNKIAFPKFKGASWDIEFEPSMSSIQRLKFQQSAHSEESVFQVKTENGNLIFSFGDSSTHAGSFVFQAGVSGKLSHVREWPVSHTISILNLQGDLSMKIADGGMMQITVDSGLAEYNYLIPAYIK